jgi:hypothetical protein
MKKLVLAAAACIMGLSLFIGVQTASSATVIPDVIDYGGNWEALSGDDLIIIEFNGTIGANEEFGYYTGTFDRGEPTTVTLIDGNTPFSVYKGIIPEESWKFYFWDGKEPYLTYDYFIGGTPGHYELIANDDMMVTVYEAVPTPVPTAALLLGSGLVGLVGFRRRFGK